jgi:hypothetical protein
MALAIATLCFSPPAMPFPIIQKIISIMKRTTVPDNLSPLSPT